MRVLITGGAGFLGSHLCDRFLTEGHSVLAMDNLITGSMDNIAHLLGHESFTFFKHNASHKLKSKVVAQGKALLNRIFHFYAQKNFQKQWKGEFHKYFIHVLKNSSNAAVCSSPHYTMRRFLTAFVE